MSKTEQIIPITQIVWINGIDEKIKTEVLDLLVEMLMEQYRRKQITLTGLVRRDKFEAGEGG